MFSNINFSSKSFNYYELNNKRLSKLIIIENLTNLNEQKYININKRKI